MGNLVFKEIIVNSIEFLKNFRKVLRNSIKFKEILGKFKKL